MFRPAFVWAATCPSTARRNANLSLSSTGSWPMTLTQEQISWGAASMLIRSHGDEAKMHADTRISELAAIGDDQSVATGNKIGCCINMLNRTGPN